MKDLEPSAVAGKLFIFNLQTVARYSKKTKKELVLFVQGNLKRLMLLYVSTNLLNKYKFDVNNMVTSDKFQDLMVYFSSNNYL